MKTVLVLLILCALAVLIWLVDRGLLEAEEPGMDLLAEEAWALGPPHRRS